MGKTINPIEPPVVRGKGGRFVSTKCPDPNCSGALVVFEDYGPGNRWWACDGLTYRRDDDELEACRQMVEA